MQLRTTMLTDKKVENAGSLIAQKKEPIHRVRNDVPNEWSSSFSMCDLSKGW